MTKCHKPNQQSVYLSSKSNSYKTFWRQIFKDLGLQLGLNIFYYPKFKTLRKVIDWAPVKVEYER